MVPRGTLVRGLCNRNQPGFRCSFQSGPCTVVRQLHGSPSWSTDGVYKDLTSMRVRTPWIEALRRKQTGGDEVHKGHADVTKSSHHVLKAKKMSDSFHRVVRRLSSPFRRSADSLD